MTVFAIIEPARQSTVMVDCEFDEAKQHAKLGNVDHGVVLKLETLTIGIAVYEFSLYVPPEKQSYFAINGKLYAGNAIVYAEDESGPIDLPDIPKVAFMPGVSAVERSIALGLVERPQLLVDGLVIWQWPQPCPP